MKTDQTRPSLWTRRIGWASWIMLGINLIFVVVCVQLVLHIMKVTITACEHAITVVDCAYIPPDKQSHQNISRRGPLYVAVFIESYADSGMNDRKTALAIYYGLHRFPQAYELLSVEGKVYVDDLKTKWNDEGSLGAPDRW